MPPRVFLNRVRNTAATLDTLIRCYNQSVAVTGLPGIEKVRMCLFSGNVYCHKESSKVEVASEILRETITRKRSSGPSARYSYAYDEGSFQEAWDITRTKPTDGESLFMFRGTKGSDLIKRPQAYLGGA